MKKVLVLVLAIMMVVALVPAVVTAEAADGAVTGSTYSAAALEGSSARVVTMAVDPSENTEAEQKYNDMVKQVLYIINRYVVRACLLVATIVFLIFGIINAVKFSKATEEEARQKAKKNLIGWFVGVILTFAMIWLLPLLFDFLIDLLPGAGLTDIT